MNLSKCQHPPDCTAAMASNGIVLPPWPSSIRRYNVIRLSCRTLLARPGGGEAPLPSTRMVKKKATEFNRWGGFEPMTQGRREAVSHLFANPSYPTLAWLAHAHKARGYRGFVKQRARTGGRGGGGAGLWEEGTREGEEQVEEEAEEVGKKHGEVSKRRRTRRRG